MRKQLLVLVSAFLLIGCSKQGGQNVDVSSMSVTTTPLETSLTQAQTTTSTTTSTTTTSTSVVTTTTRSDYLKLKDFMTSITNVNAIIELYNGNGNVSKTFELTTAMDDSFVSMLRSYQETEVVKWPILFKITFENGDLYIARKNDDYRFGLSEDKLIGEFKNTEFLDKLAAYNRNSFLNYLNTPGEEVTNSDDYFKDMEQDEQTGVYVLNVDNTKYGLKSYYDLTNEIYYSDFFDINKFEMNRVNYDYVNQIGYVNKCIYEVSGISYTTCSNNEIDIIKQHVKRFLNDGVKYLERSTFYKELGYDDLELSSEFEDILYTVMDEELYRDRHFKSVLSDSYKATEKDYHASSLASDIEGSDVILVGKVISENKLFDYGEFFEGEANDLIYSAYDISVKELLKGETNDEIHLIFAGGYLNDVFTNSDFFEDLELEGEYIMLLNKVENEVDDDLYEVHNIYMNHDLMYFEEGKLSIWKERADYNKFIAGADETKIIQYLKEVINYRK